MRIKIIGEGFKLQPTNYDSNNITDFKDPNSLWQLTYTDKGSKLNPADLKAKIRNLLQHNIKSPTQSAELQYFDDDDVDHIIATQSSMKQVNLNSFIDKHHLPTFSKSIIYYAFTNKVHQKSSKQDYSDKAIKSITDEIDKNIDKLDTYSISFRSSEDEIRHQYRDATRSNNQDGPILREVLLVIHYLYKFLEIKSPYLKNITIEALLDRLYKYAIEPMAIASSYQVAKRLKNPQTPSDIKASQTFIDLSVQKFVTDLAANSVVDYNQIIFPETSKATGSFNYQLAKQLSNEIGGQQNPIQISMVKKKSVVTPSDIDMTQLIQRAIKDIQSQQPPYILDKSGSRSKFTSITSYAQAWAQNEYDKLVNIMRRLRPVAGADNSYNARNQQGAPVRLASIPQDKRRYFKIYDPASINSITEKDNILIIDDNVVGGSTVELLHEILVSLPNPPNKIDVFVPFKIAGW